MSVDPVDEGNSDQDAPTGDKGRRKKRRVRIVGIGLLVVFVLFIFAAVGFMRYSTTPAFCNSCHIMKPYYDAWATSGHDFVPCVDCHYPPGFMNSLNGKVRAASQVVKYVTRTYSTKPYAEIEDASCLRKGCHERRLLKGKVIFKDFINFDHKPHLTEVRRGKRLRCTSCHSQIVQGEHIAVTEETCFLCHFKGRKKNSRDLNPLGGCLSCHDAPKREIEYSGITFSHEEFVHRGVDCQKCHLDTVQGDGGVPKRRCIICHGEPERLALYEDPEFVHELHVTEHNVECLQCHDEIKHAVTTRVEPLEYRCDVCHVSKHGGEKAMYMGIQGKGVPDMPSPMFLANVDCVGCHIITGPILPVPCSRVRPTRPLQRAVSPATAKGTRTCSKCGKRWWKAPWPRSSLSSARQRNSSRPDGPAETRTCNSRGSSWMPNIITPS